MTLRQRIQGIADQMTALCNAFTVGVNTHEVAHWRDAIVCALSADDPTAELLAAAMAASGELDGCTGTSACVTCAIRARLQRAIAAMERT